MPSGFGVIFSVIFTLGRSCREQNPIVASAEVDALISKNYRYTFCDPHGLLCATSEVPGHSSHALMAEQSRKSAVTTSSSMTMEIMAVTKAFI